MRGAGGSVLFQRRGRAGGFGKGAAFRSIPTGTGEFQKGTASGRVSRTGRPGARITELAKQIVV